MIYLDNAATSFPKPESVYRRIDEVLRKKGGNPGRSSHALAMEASRVVFGAREAAARLIGTPDSSRIVFTKNATEAINVALKGILKPGDHVVTSTFEHNSVSKCILRLEKAGIKATRVAPGKDGFLSPGDIGAAIRKETRLVCITHASNVLGAIEPVAEIGRVCRSKGALFMVDAAQTAGATPIDVIAMGVNVLAATGHKALFGPQGTGFLYIEEGLEPEQFVDGGSGLAESELELPERLEAGTINTPGIGGLGAGIEFLLSEGVEKIRAHEKRLVEALLKGLSAIKGVSITGPLDAAKRAALVAFNIDGRKPVDVGLMLDADFGMMIRCGTHCAPDAHREANTLPEGSARVSPGYFNTEEEIEAFLKAIRKIAGK